MKAMFMTDQTNATPVAPLTKDEKLAKIAKQIEALQAKYDDVLNDRVTVKVAKIVYVPAAGDVVFVPVGRNTASTKATTEEGVVTAFKPAVVNAEGKTTSAAQVRVRIRAGQFDEQLLTLYPAQLTKKKDEAPVENTDENLPALEEATA